MDRPESDADAPAPPADDAPAEKQDEHQDEQPDAGPGPGLVLPDDDEEDGVAPTLVGISFDDTFRAQEFYTAAQGLAAHHGFTLKDAVIVMKTPEGRAHVQETMDLSPGRTALSAGLWAGLFGLILGGPVGWAAGVAVGAGTGAVTAKLVDLGIPDEWVAWFKDAVEPGRVIVALLVEDLDENALVGEVERFAGAELVYANLDPGTIARIKAGLES